MDYGVREDEATKKAAENAVKYAARQHRYRAFTIARTELAAAYNHGGYSALKNAQAKGFIVEVKKIWLTADDERVCKVCGAIDGEKRDVDEKFSIGKLLPPAHPNCRCAVAYEEVDNGGEDGIINIGGALNPDSTRAQKHAERYYQAVRKMKTDVKRISENTGYDEDTIQSIKNFIFLEKHDLEGVYKYFDPSFEMAQSWQRLIDGKNIQPHDLTLIKHEIMEKRLMQIGLSQNKAHEITSSVYNYGKESDEYYDKIRKYNKKG